jgi:cytochrome b561
MTEVTRFHSLAITLHWLMAIGFIIMAASGWYMVNGGLSKAAQFDLYQLHKAGGVIMLWAIILRLIARLSTRQPALPKVIPERQRTIAKWGHWGLYTGLVIIPVAGWFMVSSSPYGLPTFVFVDWIKWPHIPGLAGDKSIQSVAKTIHWYAVLCMLLLLAMHIGAVGLHKIKHKTWLVKRMWWS